MSAPTCPPSTGYVTPLCVNHTPFPTVAHHALALTGQPLWPALVLGIAVLAFGIVLLVGSFRRHA